MFHFGCLNVALLLLDRAFELDGEQGGFEPQQPFVGVSDMVKFKLSYGLALPNIKEPLSSVLSDKMLAERDSMQLCFPDFGKFKNFIVGEGFSLYLCTSDETFCCLMHGLCNLGVVPMYICGPRRNYNLRDAVEEINFGLLSAGCQCLNGDLLFVAIFCF